MQSPLNWRFTLLFAVVLLAGCASTNSIASQSELMDPQHLQLAPPKVSSLSLSPQWWLELHTNSNPVQAKIALIRAQGGGYQASGTADLKS